MSRFATHQFPNWLLAAGNVIRYTVALAVILAWIMLWLIALDCLAAMPFYGVCYP